MTDTLPNGHDPAPFTIRDATILDLPRLSYLFQHLCAAHPTPYPTIDAAELPIFLQTLAKAITERQPTLYLRVAAVGDVAIGFLAGEIMHRAIGRPHHYGAAHYLIVDPAYRHRGIARVLIADGQSWLQTTFPDVTHVELFAIADDTQWAARGWTPFLVKYAMAVPTLSEGAGTTAAPEEIVAWPA